MNGLHARENIQRFKTDDIPGEEHLSMFNSRSYIVSLHRFQDLFIDIEDDMITAVADSMDARLKPMFDSGPEFRFEEAVVFGKAPIAGIVGIFLDQGSTA